MKHLKLIFLSACFQIVFLSTGTAHPGSGIIVDEKGNVYFTYNGVVKISSDGTVSYFHKASDGHWLCLDEMGSFSRTNPIYFKRISPEAESPAIIFAGGGSPIVVNKDGNLYYCGGLQGDLNPGAKTIIRESPQKQQFILNPRLEDSLDKLDDGITALTAAPDGSLYLGCWNSLLRVGIDGKISMLLHPVLIRDCDEDLADHRVENRGKPLLRGIAVDSGGSIYAAATSCHCLIKISPDKKITTILKSERPWTPTGVALRNGELYILEYTNANGPRTEGWLPRVRKIDRNGQVSTLADFSKNQNQSFSLN